MRIVVKTSRRDTWDVERPWVASAQWDKPSGGRRNAWRFGATREEAFDRMARSALQELGPVEIERVDR